jgi:hypothetical protein
MQPSSTHSSGVAQEIDNEQSPSSSNETTTFEVAKSIVGAWPGWCLAIARGKLLGHCPARRVREHRRRPLDLPLSAASFRSVSNIP